MTQDTNTASGAADRENFIRWYTDNYRHDEMLAAHRWDNNHGIAEAWRAALAASHGQAPAETGNSVSAQTDSVLEDAARYRWLAANCRSTSEHWGGRWSIVVEGPAPKSHDSEDDFDAAVDAARKQGEKQ